MGSLAQKRGRRAAGLRRAARPGARPEVAGGPQASLPGYTAALGGEAEEALEHYRQAIALDETYLEAMLNAAEVLMHPLADYDGAIDMCDEALDYAETPEEVADAVLLKVDALLGKGDVDDSRKAMAMLPDGPFDNASYSFLIGRAFYETGQIEQGGAADRRGGEEGPGERRRAVLPGPRARRAAATTRGATEAFLRARGLDLTREPPAWSPTVETFASVVESVVGKLDAVLARYVQEAEVYVVDVPGAELVVDGVDPRRADDPRCSAQLRMGAAGSERGTRRGSSIYQRNVERSAGTLDAIEDELSRALEAGDHVDVPQEKDPMDVRRWTSTS